MKYNEFAQKEIDNKIAQMRQNPQLVDASLGFVAKMYLEFGQGSMLKQVALMMNEIMYYLMLSAEDVSSFSESGMLIECLMDSAIEIDQAAAECPLKKGGKL